MYYEYYTSKYELSLVPILVASASGSHDRMSINLDNSTKQALELQIELELYALSRLRNNKELNDGFSKKIIPGSTVVHVRRNDYVYLKEDLKINS